MGLTNKLHKSVKKLPRQFIAKATFENWEAEPAEAVDQFVKDLIAQIKADKPNYRYVKSALEYTHDGNIDFHFRFELKDFKGALSISHR